MVSTEETPKLHWTISVYPFYLFIILVSIGLRWVIGSAGVSGEHVAPNVQGIGFGVSLLFLGLSSFIIGIALTVINTIKPPKQLIFLNDFKGNLQKSRFNQELIRFDEESTSFEKYLFLGGLILFPFTFLTISWFQIALAIVAILYSLYHFKERRLLREKLKAFLPQYTTPISLKSLAKHFKTNREKLYNEIMSLVIDENFPVFFDLERKEVSYSGVANNSQTVIVSETQVKEVVCEYCGEVNNIPGAKFCISCGVSLYPAK